jgi:hypothetical protein
MSLCAYIVNVKDEKDGCLDFNGYHCYCINEEKRQNGKKPVQFGKVLSTIADKRREKMDTKKVI